ncbi:ECF transporter S component [Bacillus horti]|uniref:Energy-coupling factor transport system substrate-specific component n=1 Tax=Caldalkalibacillus horti TaxID=77523 RepID=A0ABT9W0G9_9BACI|nr:ECF transporter S component [Bacillus horti]MDQ0166748.1 energy-coupling factor transport system substrate-specific component [Bacillus horti]
MKKKGLTLTDILVTVVIAIIFAVIYKLWGPLYYALKPFGLHLEQAVYGMWFMAATVAFLIIRKPGVALLAEVAAASGELVMGAEWGLETLVYGVFQGLGAELIFLIFAYKSYSLFVTSLAAIGATAGSFVMDTIRGYIFDYELWNLLLLIGMRTVGSIIIVGVCAYYLVKALESTGVTELVRSSSKEDYDALNK